MKKEFSNILVTGGAGCIGLQICKELVDRGFSVILFDLPEQIVRVEKHIPPKVKIEYVKQILQPTLDEVLKEKPTDKTVKYYKEEIKDYFKAKEEYNNLPNELTYEYRNKKRELGKYFNPTSKFDTESYSENVKKVHAIYVRYTRPAIAFSGQQVATLITLKVEEVTLEYLTKFWSDYKTRLENEIARFETDIKNWKLQPTPRERLTKFQANDKIQASARKSTNNNPESKTRGENDE